MPHYFVLLGREGRGPWVYGEAVVISFVVRQHPKDCNEHRLLDLIRVKSEHTRTVVRKDYRGSHSLLEKSFGSPISSSALAVY